MTTDTDIVARRLLTKWAERIGHGFHPDTRGDEYTGIRTNKPTLTEAEAEQYDSDMDEVFELLPSDEVYQYALYLLQEPK